MRFKMVTAGRTYRGTKKNKISRGTDKVTTLNKAYQAEQPRNDYSHFLPMGKSGTRIFSSFTPQ